MFLMIKYKISQAMTTITRDFKETINERAQNEFEVGYNQFIFAA